jgi:hypothetical protein
VAKKLRGFLYFAGQGASVAEAITYRANFGEREMMMIWPNWSASFAGDAVARAMGLRARIDADTGWHKTISNVPVTGVTGIAVDVTFDFGSEDTDAALLNAAGITTLVRFAGGYRYWGNRTCSSEPLYAFESVVRTSQVLADEIAQGLAWASDKPMTIHLVKDVIETINARIRTYVTQGRLIGGACWYDPALNAEADLAAGKAVLDYDFTGVAPLEGRTQPAGDRPLLRRFCQPAGLVTRSIPHGVPLQAQANGHASRWPWPSGRNRGSDHPQARPQDRGLARGHARSGADRHGPRQARVRVFHGRPDSGRARPVRHHALAGALVRFVGAYQEDQTGTVKTIEVVCMGRYTEIDFGNAKAGDNTVHKYKMACSYYRLIVDGVDWIEIDLINMIFIVMGVDRYADIRAALGR